MKIGSFTIEILSEGQFEMFEDGHINRSPSNKDTEEPQHLDEVPDNSSQVGINPVLVRTGRHNILLDTGLGWGLDAGSDNQQVSNVRTNLGIFNLRPEDITHVILTHLHYDHIAGGSYTGTGSSVKPTFPNATYFVHEEEWSYALSRFEKNQELVEVDYQLDDFYRLIADNHVELLQGDSTKIIDGLSALWTGGHTPGHQIVQLQSNGEYAYYFGDLLPSKPHLNVFPNEKWDVNPLHSSAEKSKLFRKAYKENAIIFLYHSKNGELGRLSTNKAAGADAYIFEGIPLY